MRNVIFVIVIGFVLPLSLPASVFGQFKDYTIAEGTKFDIKEPGRYGGKIRIHNDCTGKISIGTALLDLGRIEIGDNCEVSITLGDDVEGTIDVGENCTVNIMIGDSVDGGRIRYRDSSSGTITIVGHWGGQIDVGPKVTIK